MESCAACGSQLQGHESECPDCGLALMAKAPDTTAVVVNPLDGSVLALSTGLPLVEAPEEDLDASPALASSDLSPSPNRGKWGIAALILIPASLIGLVVFAATREQSPPAAKLHLLLEGRAGRVQAQPLPGPADLDAMLRELKAASPGACKSAEAARAPFTPAEQADLHTLAGAYFARRARIDPDWAASLGMHPHPIGITPVDPKFSASYLYLALDLRAALEVWRAAGGSPSAHEETDYRLLSAFTELLSGGPSQSDLLLRFEAGFDPLVGLAIFECCPGPERAEAAIARIKALTERMASLPGDLTKPPRALVESAIRRLPTLRRYLDTYPMRWTVLRSRFEEPCAAAVAGLDSLREDLVQLVLPRATGELGLGAADYERELRRYHCLPFGAQELAVRALDALQLAYEEISRLGPSLEPGPIADTSFHQRLHEGLSRHVWQLRQESERWILEPPPSDPGLVIGPIPELWTHSYASAFYLSLGPLAPHDSGVAPAYLTGAFPALDEAGARLSAEHTAAHETYPGHHLHHVLARESSCDLRLGYDCRFSQEGWAVYATEISHKARLHEEVGRRRDTYELALERYGAAFDALFDVLIHTRAASPEELLELWRLYQGDPKLSLADLGDRARYYSAYYFTGRHLVGQLRDEVRAKLGDAFSGREFHDRFMRAGFAPPHLLVKELSSPR